MSDRVEVKVTYSEHDFVRGMTHAQHRVGWTWVNIVSSMASVIIGFGLVYWLAFREQGPIRLNDAIVGVVVLFISYPLAIGLDRVRPSAAMQFAKLFRENPVYQEEFSVRIDAQGIYSRSASFESLVHWDAFAKGFESDDDFYFLLSVSQPLFFPKRAFSPEQMLTLRRIASEEMGDEASFLR